MKLLVSWTESTWSCRKRRRTWNSKSQTGSQVPFIKPIVDLGKKRVPGASGVYVFCLVTGSAARSLPHCHHLRPCGFPPKTTLKVASKSSRESASEKEQKETHVPTILQLLQILLFFYWLFFLFYCRISILPTTCNMYKNSYPTLILLRFSSIEQQLFG